MLHSFIDHECSCGSSSQKLSLLGIFCMVKVVIRKETFLITTLTMQKSLEKDKTAYISF